MGKAKKTATDPITPLPSSKRKLTAQAAATLTDNIDQEEATPVDILERFPSKKTRNNKKQRDPLPCIDPDASYLLDLQSKSLPPPPLPVPNFGYACLNSILRDLKPSVFTSRDCIKRTLDTKGRTYLGELCLANCKDLARLIQWNAEHGVRFFRMSSVLWPWMGTFDFSTDIPQKEEIKEALKFAGDLARAHDIRITFHPSHFVKLGTEDRVLAEKSMKELEVHSEILDLMGYDEASPWNKINIHVGGVYGNKAGTLKRWAANYKQLSLNCQKRVTVENDDIANSYSLEDLLDLHNMCGVPLVFDFHHHRFCPGSLTEEQAFKAAIKTWPAGVRPVVHWSESQAGRKPHAHSDYVRGPIYLHGLERDVDVMIEAKAKEQALLCYRDGLPIPDDVVAIEEVAPPVMVDAEMGMKMDVV